MKKRRIEKRIICLLACALVVCHFSVLPTQAGASNIIIDSSSFEEKIDSSLWNNQSGDVTVEDGKLCFSKNSTVGTALITKARAKISEYHDEVVNVEAKLRLKTLPKDEKFVLALGLKSVEGYVGEAGNIEIQFQDREGLKTQVVVNGTDGEVENIGKAASCGNVGRDIWVSAIISREGNLCVTVDGKTICDQKLSVNGEGCVGFLQTGKCEAEVLDVKITSHRYDQPENCNVVEDFENETINVNALTSKLIHSGDGQLPSKTYINEKNENRVFQFMNTSTTYLGTIYQYSNFEMTFDVIDLQRETVTDEDGNLVAARTDNFAISFGGDAADYTGYGYDNATDLLIFQNSSIFSWHTDNHVDVASQGYAFSDPECKEDFSVKLEVMDSVITVSMKWIDETEYKEVMRYQITEETPCGHIHIWTTAKTSTFALDNLTITNKDQNPNLIDVEYQSGLIEVPQDFAYEPLERVYRETEKEKDIRPYGILGVAVGICALTWILAILIKRKKRLGGE